jgi:hypothetical protein
MLVEARLAPKVPVARVAGDSNALELTRGARHKVAARLIAYVRDVTFTPFVASFADVTSGHRASQTCEHVIMSLNIIETLNERLATMVLNSGTLLYGKYS